jgi:hypothetical protein
MVGVTGIEPVTPTMSNPRYDRGHIGKLPSCIEGHGPRRPALPDVSQPVAGRDRCKVCYVPRGGHAATFRQRAEYLIHSFERGRQLGSKVVAACG